MIDGSILVVLTSATTPDVSAIPAANALSAVTTVPAIPAPTAPTAPPIADEDDSVADSPHHRYQDSAESIYGTDDNVELADEADDDSVELSSDDTAFYTDAIDMILNDAASKMFVKCSPPSHTDKEFTASDFETHMSDNVELMRAALSSYSPDPQPIQNYHDLVELFKKRQAYHTDSLPRESIRVHFMDTFNKDHFRYQNAEDTSVNKRYGLTLIPTDKLYTCNTVLHKAMTESLVLLTSLIKGAGHSIRSIATSMLIK